MQFGDGTALFVYLSLKNIALVVHLCNFKHQATDMEALLSSRILQHTVFWCFYVLIYTANYGQDGKYDFELLVTMGLLPFHLLFTYLQLYIFIPFLLLKKKFIKYILITIIVTKMLVGFSFLFYGLFVFQAKYGKPAPEFDWSIFYTFHLIQLQSVFSYFMICGVAVSIKLLKKWFYENDRNQKIEKEKLFMELEMLKAQVHPHFLFNTLNNLYSLTLTHSDKAPVVVTHLADLLRYMLYECNENEVPLEKEIEVLKKYVELEKIRYGDRIDVSFSCGGDLKENKIAPLILLPFIENSFKHSVSEQVDQCWVNLHLHANGNEFTFNLSNSSADDKPKSAAGGIGLQNISKRLELIYPGKYSLTINEEAEMYVVKLKMQLNHVAERANLPQSFSHKTSAAV